MLDWDVLSMESCDLGSTIEWARSLQFNYAILHNQNYSRPHDIQVFRMLVFGCDSGFQDSGWASSHASGKGCQRARGRQARGAVLWRRASAALGSRCQRARSGHRQKDGLRSAQAKYIGLAIHPV